MVKAPTDLQKKKPRTKATSDAGSKGVDLENTVCEDELEGALLGNIIHRAFELIVKYKYKYKDKDKDKYDKDRKHELVKHLVEEYLGETGDTTQEKDIINDMIDTFLSSNLIKELRQSPALQTEVPFHLLTQPGEKLSQYAEVYLPQLEVYKEVFEIITGEKVCDYGVYFARIGEYVSLCES